MGYTVFCIYIFFKIYMDEISFTVTNFETTHAIEMPIENQIYKII